MAAFEAKFVGGPEDLPNQLIGFDLRTDAFASQPQSLGADEVQNRASQSLRRFAGGDIYHSPWSNAKVIVAAPARDAAAFDGVGGLNFTSADQVMDLNVDGGFPAVPSG